LREGVGADSAASGIGVAHVYKTWQRHALGSPDSSQGRLTIFGTRFFRANCKSKGARPRTIDRLAAPICSHVPNAIWRLDETIFTGDGGIAKNIGMVGRINPDQAAGYHVPAVIAAALFGCDRGSGPEHAERSGEGKRDERSVSNHDDFPFVCGGG